MQPRSGCTERQGDACRALPRFHPANSERSSRCTPKSLRSKFTGLGPAGATTHTGTNQAEPTPPTQSIPKPPGWLRPPAQLERSQVEVFAPLVTPPSTQNPRAHSSNGRGQGADHRISESQHGRGWQGPLWVTQSNPLPKQGHPEQAA